MPKHHTLARRADNRIIDELRRLILAGIPWRQPNIGESAKGYGDLIHILTGHHYRAACDFVRAPDDRETLLTIWSELREDFLQEHIKHRPGTRPWGWWHLEDRESLRVNEDQDEYLKRHRLLSRKEKAALKSS